MGFTANKQVVGGTVINSATSPPSRRQFTPYLCIHSSFRRADFTPPSRCSLRPGREMKLCSGTHHWTPLPETGENSRHWRAGAVANLQPLTRPAVTPMLDGTGWSDR
eukprot:22631_1